MKFSIIVPIYNVSEYLERCLESIINQTYDNFEAILVNDGSTDSSVDIIDKYIKLDKRFKKIEKENGGLSSARNAGVNVSTGDYLVFVDADDYISLTLLENLFDIVNKDQYDIVRFKENKVINENIIEEDYIDINNLNGCEAIPKLIKDPLFVTAWHQAYNTRFFKENKFSYSLQRLHEDFGLTPLIYLKSKKIASIDKVGYYYIIRENSIMTSKNEEKELKRNEDMLYHFNYLITEAKKLNIDSKTLEIFNSFLANSIINRCKDLKGNTLNTYLKEIKKYNVSAYLIEDTFARKLKKITFKLFPKLYIKFYLK